MFSSYSNPPIDRIFVDWYQILQTRYSGHTLNSQWPVVIFCPALEWDYLYKKPKLVHTEDLEPLQHLGPFVTTRHNGVKCQRYLTLVLQRSYFERPLVLHIFSVLPVKFNTSKISNKCHVRKVVHITCRRKRTTLCQWFHKLLPRVEPRPLVFYDTALT